MILEKKIIFYINEFISKYPEENIANISGTNIDQSKIDSGLIARVNKILLKKICDLNTVDVATLLRQKIGGKFVLAMGILILLEEPLIKADNYSGDLLSYCLDYNWEEWMETEIYGIDLYDTIGFLDFAIPELENRCVEIHKKYEIIRKNSHM